ncbi:N-glycosyltransferase [Actinobacillus equuli]|nr:N-glycosyltransferase [Actinobacillus equuli]
MNKEDVPLVSLMVPCYNESDNLDEAVPHLLNLKYPNYELILSMTVVGITPAS